MQKNVILITGVSGLLGRAISHDLAKNFVVAGLDLKKPSSNSEVHFYKTDLTDRDSIKNSLKAVAQDHGDRLASVIHLAAYYDFSGAPSGMYEKLTVNGTRNLIKTLKELDYTVEQFVFASTHLVMKPARKGELINESDPLQGDWDYPKSKIAAEEAIREELGEIPATILRVSGVYDSEGHSPPVCRQIQRIYEKQFTSHFYPGDQEKGQPFVHIDDVVKAFRLAVEKRNALGPRETIFIAEPELLSYGELQDRIGRLIYEKEWKTFPTPKTVAKAGAYAMNKKDNSNFIKPWMIDLTEAHYPLSQKRARKKLGFIAERRLYEELPLIVDNLMKNPKRWYEINKLGEPPEKREDFNQSQASP